MSNEPGGDPFYAAVERFAAATGAERATLFLHDREKHEVWSKVALGLEIPEIRLRTTRGVVGFVARTGQTVNLRDAYNDPRFNRDIDQQTGYRTRSILTMAIKDADDHVIGVLQALNKPGMFTPEDEAAMVTCCEEAARLLASEQAT